jgi:lipopolysaccharide transport system permease protein
MSRLVIESGRSHKEYWRDLWRYRELFYVLAWRDITVRYKQTAIGIIWALLQPLINTIIFTILWGKLAKMPSDGIPYPLIVMTGMLPWGFIAASLSSASQSLVGNSNLISKVYFPRLIIPASAVVTAMVDLFIGFLLLAAFMAWYHIMPDWRMASLPFFVILAFLAALGPGLFITALNVKYRDFRYIIPVIVQMGYFVSPVGYLSSNVSDKWRPIYSLNPAVGVIDGFRWALLGGSNTIDPRSFTLSLVVMVFLLWLGITYFRKMERSFADVI